MNRNICWWTMNDGRTEQFFAYTKNLSVKESMRFTSVYDKKIWSFKATGSPKAHRLSFYAELI